MHTAGRAVSITELPSNGDNPALTPGSEATGFAAPRNLVCVIL